MFEHLKRPWGYNLREQLNSKERCGSSEGLAVYASKARGEETSSLTLVSFQIFIIKNGDVISN